jgi:DNA invertase Pin-like site-specific DNA recombinase
MAALSWPFKARKGLLAWRGYPCPLASGSTASEIIRERVNAGIARAKARGVKFGRPTTIDAHRENVAQLRARGRSGRAIAKELGIPSSNVFRVIADLQKVV